MSTCSGSRRRSNSRWTSGDCVDVPSTTIAYLSVMFVALVARLHFSRQPHLSGDHALDTGGCVHEERALVVDRGRGARERSATVDADLDAVTQERGPLDPFAMRGREFGGVREPIELS